MNNYTQAAIFILPPNIWQLGEQPSPWLQILDAQAMYGRRLAKSIELSDVRTSMLDLARRISFATRTIPVDLIWKVPPELLESWYALLNILADERAVIAGKKLNRHSIPPFLPCVFGPAEHSINAGVYGLLEVADHVLELLVFKNKLLPNFRKLERALEKRLERFQSAVAIDAGLAEWILPECEEHT